MDRVSSERIVSRNKAPVNPGGEFVLYWMIAFRRVHWNFSLERAAEWARELGKPLLVLEALRCDYPWASERLHSFILDGMRDNRTHLKGTGAFYYPFVEHFKDQGKGLLRALALRAAVIVTDDYPAYFLPRMVRAAARDLPIKMEAVDSNGLFPMRMTDRVFSTALSFRRVLQQELPNLLDRFPKQDPLSGPSIPVLPGIPSEITEQWPPAAGEAMESSPENLSTLPIDHTVKAVEARGGSEEAGIRLRDFLQHKVHIYHTEGKHPDENAVSGLSPYLHFGHISTHEIFSRLTEAEEWSRERISARACGRREGWWGMSEGAEAFLDQLVTWREIGFNMCSKRDDYDQLASLPGWALNELMAHAADHRSNTYTLQQFESAKTHDPLWNAAQRQLIEEGGIHNTPRMLWGKKVFEWSASPLDALKIMIELNNRYALDGRDPNSYTGIFWVLGRYDRPFGPSRPVFGKVRYMSSASMLRRIKIEEYMNRYGEGSIKPD